MNMRFYYLFILVSLIGCEDKSSKSNTDQPESTFNSQPPSTQEDQATQEDPSNQVDQENMSQEDDAFIPEAPLPQPWQSPFQLGTEGIDQALGLDVLPNHDVVIAGRTEGVLVDRGEVGLGDGFVALIRDSGELGWIKQLGTSALDQFLDVVYHPQELIIAGGLSTGDYAGEVNTQLMDGILVALSVDGNVLWEKKLNLGTVNRLFPTSNGVIVVGSYEEMQGDPAAFVAHYTLEGEREWLATLNSPDFDSATSATVVNDHVYVSGFTFGSIVNQETRSDMSIFIGQFSMNGELIWVKEYGGDHDDSAVRITHDQEGLIVAGYTGGLLGEEHYGSNDVAVLKLTFDGDLLWQKQFGTSGSESAYGLTVSPDGQIILSGRIDEASWDERSNRNGDAFILELSAEGQQLNVVQYGSNGRDEFVDVAYSQNMLCISGYWSLDEENMDIWVDRVSSFEERMYP